MIKKLFDRIAKWLEETVGDAADLLRPKVPVPVRVRVRKSCLH